jgi:hypothetical protein
MIALHALHAVVRAVVRSRRDYPTLWIIIDTAAVLAALAAVAVFSPSEA